MNTETKAHQRRSGDRPVIILATISLVALLALTVTHSPLVLGLLMPASVLWLRWQREARTSSEGMGQLRLAVAAALARAEAAEGASGNTARRATPRLHLVASHIE
jgi:hypothetical protein